jgi:hypothetical protein
MTYHMTLELKAEMENGTNQTSPNIPSLFKVTVRQVFQTTSPHFQGYVEILLGEF